MYQIIPPIWNHGNEYFRGYMRNYTIDIETIKYSLYRDNYYDISLYLCYLTAKIIIII